MHSSIYLRHPIPKSLFSGKELSIATLWLELSSKRILRIPNE